MGQGPNVAFGAYKQGSNIAAPSTVGKQGDLLASYLHGEKYNQAYNGNLFRGANAAAVTLSAALATTYVGLCLSNPAGNTKNLVVRRVSGVMIIAPANFIAVGLIVGFVAAGIVTHTTPVTTLGSGFLGAGTSAGAAPSAKLDAACTLVGTPVWAEWLAANAATAGNTNFSADIQGAIIVPPGGYVAIGSNVAGPASGFLGSFEWEEVAV